MYFFLVVEIVNMFVGCGVVLGYVLSEEGIYGR